MQTKQLFSSTESVGGKLFEAGNFKFCTANDNVSNHMHELQFASAISILQILLGFVPVNPDDNTSNVCSYLGPMQIRLDAYLKFAPEQHV